MEGAVLPLNQTVILRPTRPIQDWIVLSASHGHPITPTQAAEVVRDALRAILAHGHPILAQALWMKADGTIEVGPGGTCRCSTAACLKSMGFLACEMLAGGSIGTTDSEQALAAARFNAVTRHPFLWAFPFEAGLCRLLGISRPFNTLEEALTAFEYIANPGGSIHEAFGLLSGQAAYTAHSNASRSHRWLFPAFVGAVLMNVVLLSVGSAYTAGQKRGLQEAAISTPAKVPSSPALPIGPDLLSTHGLLEARDAAPKPRTIRKQVQPKRATLPAPLEVDPEPAEADDGPIRIPAATENGRVTSRDFVARTK